MTRVSFLLAALPLVVTSAFAATQGSLSTTSSTGSYSVTVTGPLAQRQIQVLNISDIAFSSTDMSTYYPSRPGKGSAFCIVDTYGGGLQMTIASGNGANWVVKDGNGNELGYTTYLTWTDGTAINHSNAGSASFTSNLAAGRAAASSASCGSGNIRIEAYMNNLMPETVPVRTYTDTVTITMIPI